MAMNTNDIEAIVKQVIAGMKEAPVSAPAQSSFFGKHSGKRLALPATKTEHFDIKEYPLPEIGDDDVLVKVEGCGVCGTDAHEFKRRSVWLDSGCSRP